MTCIALDEKAEKSIHAHQTDGPVCLVMGDETEISDGVAHDARSAAIADDGQNRSLNVSVAAGIALSHISLWKEVTGC